MAYVQTGKQIRYKLIPGYKAPLNIAARGTMIFQSNERTSGGYMYMIPGTGVFTYNASSLIEMFNIEAYQNKTLFVVEWENTYGETIQWEIKTTNTKWDINIIVKNLFTNETVYNSTLNLQSILQDINRSNKPRINFGFGRVNEWETGSYNYGRTIACFAFGDSVAGHPTSSNAYITHWTSIQADSEGTDAQKAAYRAFEGIPVDDKDTGNESEPAGGGGSWEYVDDTIDFPALPTDSVLASDFLRLYHITAPALATIGADLWSNNFFTNILKNYDSPFENIISLNILPVNVSGTPAQVWVGNYETAASGEKITTQFVDLDGGTCQIPKIFGNQLDFNPASSAQIFIPYVGFREIDLDDLSGGVATLKYRVDLLNGNLIAMLRITQTDRYNHDSVEYFFNGNCATSIPISGANYSQMYAGMLNAGLGAASSALAGNALGVVGGASSIMTSKPQYQRAGNLSGNVGFMGQQRAFILLSSPLQSIAGDIKHLEGLRSNVTAPFSGLSGFQKIEEYTPNTTLAAECIAEELQEIKNLLMEGVYF